MKNFRNIKTAALITLAAAIAGCGSSATSARDAMTSLGDDLFNVPLCFLSDSAGAVGRVLTSEDAPHKYAMEENKIYYLKVTGLDSDGVALQITQFGECAAESAKGAAMWSYQTRADGVVYGTRHDFKPEPHTGGTKYVTEQNRDYFLRVIKFGKGGFNEPDEIAICKTKAACENLPAGGDITRWTYRLKEGKVIGTRLPD